MPQVNKLNRPWHSSTVKKPDGFYHLPAWKRLRKAMLRENPICYYCEQEGTVSPASVLDHQLPRRLFPELEWDEPNLKPCCTTCHNKKRWIEGQCATRAQAIEKLTANGYL